MLIRELNFTCRVAEKNRDFSFWFRNKTTYTTSNSYKKKLKSYVPHNSVCILVVPNGSSVSSYAHIGAWTTFLFHFDKQLVKACVISCKTFCPSSCFVIANIPSPNLTSEPLHILTSSLFLSQFDRSNLRRFEDSIRHEITTENENLSRSCAFIFIVIY